MWFFDRAEPLRDRIAPEGNRRLQTAICQTLGQKYDKLRRGDVKIAGKDAIIVRGTIAIAKIEMSHKKQNRIKDN
jgi:hypothetical protein